MGVIFFDHRVLSYLPIDQHRLTSQRLKSLLHLLAQPLTSEETAETQDEIWKGSQIIYIGAVS